MSFITSDTFVGKLLAKNFLKIAQSDHTGPL